MSVFYETYGDAKGYETPDLNAKHIAKFDKEVWEPSQVQKSMSCLEIGCGTGHFLSYLHHKGVEDIKAIDLDPNLTDIIPEHVRPYFEATDIFEFLNNAPSDKLYDRIFMFDVLEHFSAEDGRKLLISLGQIMAPRGEIVLKMPNASSPWGLKYQFGDITHITCYTPGSIRQMAVSAGLVCRKCYPHVLGNRSRIKTDKLVQIILNKLIAEPLEIWEGNFFAILLRPED
jgi:2-polyprenyl-3-methyl-5-hydroxy-6-metoxy-1,4-benzoquinol methylase